jgi:molecular chaperone DnaK
MARIVGIDLGTSTSEIAYFAHGAPVMIATGDEGPITPSAVWENPNGELIVGLAAYQQADAVKEFKREMGEKGRQFHLGHHVLTPPECSSFVLRYLLERFRETAGEAADRAVITVPASWKLGPRQATEEAGRLAGIQVARLINEPTAAAMAFGLRPDSNGKTIAVYDLGGGTFDVTILRVEDGVFEVVTSSGDERLGGSDIDALLMRHVIEQLAAKTGYRHGLDKNQRADWQLKLACERAKKELSNASESVIELSFLETQQGRPVGADLAIRRETLERLIAPLVDRSLGFFDEALRHAKLKPEAIDEVVMVGGSSRIPMVRRRLAEHMGKEPNTTAVNPDEAVAQGAAIQAAIIEQEEAGGDLVLPVALDKTSHNFGVETMVRINDEAVTGVFSIIIKKGETLPASGCERYVTAVDNQRRIEVNCYQGDSRWVSENTRLAEPLPVEDLPPKPAGEVKVDISFTLSLSDLLEVEVRMEGGEVAASRRIDLAASPGAREEHARSSQRVEELWQRSELARKYKPMIDQAEAALGGELPAPQRTALEQELSRLKRAVAASDAGAADKADEQVAEILFALAER